MSVLIQLIYLRQTLNFIVSYFTCIYSYVGAVITLGESS